MSTGTGDLLGRILGGEVPAYALVHRPDATGPGAMDLLVGEVSTPGTLADVRLPAPGGAGHEALVVVPYRQIAERGFACADDGAPLLAMTVTDQAVVGVAEVLARIPEVPLALTGEHFDVDDDAYARMVRRVIAEEIGEGTGANFVIKRSFTAD
ncbi:phenazine-specific anthranilate synthase component I, partial [Streptomyces eurocidicus]|nr:phenazine-specific anthranilate synthase component I [Streptomyces eurocidicus]